MVKSALYHSSFRCPPTLISFIAYFVKRHKSFIIIFPILALWAGFWGPINSVLIKTIIDNLTSPGGLNTDVSILWPAVFLVANFEVHNLCWRGMGYLNYLFQPIIKSQLIRETFDYVHRHTHQFFQDHLAGRLSNQITTLADNVERIVHDLIRHAIRGFVLVMVALVSMYWVHPKFFWALFVWLVIFTSVSLFFSKRLVKLSEINASSESMISGQLVDSLTNSSAVRFFSRRDYELSYLEKSLFWARKSFQAKEIFALKLHCFQGFSLAMMVAFMLYFLIQLHHSHQVSIGDFALILGLSMEVGFVTWWSLEQIDELNKAVGKCKQSLSMLFVLREIVDDENASDLHITNGEITFEDVRFHYAGTDPLFEKKSVTIKAGQNVGLVGFSGSGKTTFVNLILRLYDVTQGHILIDGQDICNVTQDSLRSQIALIPQDPSLFHRSLMDNIRYGRIDASDEEVIAAAKKAHAHEFINHLPAKYESLVGERGIKLSGGQRQRIAMARAILKNAPILILDEATSQLDSVTETLIQDSLWQLMQGKTTIVIAHRLSTLLHMDRILVFDRGKIVEDGPHADLLKNGGLYKTLWEAQVGGFLPEMLSD